MRFALPCFVSLASSAAALVTTSQRRIGCRRRHEETKRSRKQTNTHTHTRPGTQLISRFICTIPVFGVDFRLLRLFQFLVSLFASCCFSFSSFATLSRKKGDRLKTDLQQSASVCGGERELCTCKNQQQLFVILYASLTLRRSLTYFTFAAELLTLSSS